MLNTELDTGPEIRVPGINGASKALVAERIIGELRRGRAAAISSGAQCTLVLSVETASADALQRLGALAARLSEQAPRQGLLLAVSARRAVALALATDEDSKQALAVCLPTGISLPSLHTLAGITGAAPAPAAATLKQAPGNAMLDAAIALMRHARLLPAVIALPVAASTLDDSVLCIDAEQTMRFEASRGTGLERIVSAHVPLRDEENCELVLFRDTSADVEHLAIVVGDISGVDAVPVRVHSACLTGDVLGSLRCDCGDQLHGAMRRMSERGGGVLLYLEQEGRGIGLANKLRAYSLQDGGLDTFDADGHLGFDPDDRSFTEAATMLRSLGVLRIQLLTNNPHKVEALVSEGIEVLSREPITGARNRHNERYLSAKATRAGHHLHNEAENT